MTPQYGRRAGVVCEGGDAGDGASVGGERSQANLPHFTWTREPTPPDLHETEGVSTPPLYHPLSAHGDLPALYFEVEIKIFKPNFFLSP